MILDEIVESTKERVETAKRNCGIETMKQKAMEICRQEDTTNWFAFEKTLKQGGISLIGEVKKASPSKGIILEEFPYMDIANYYEEIGVDAISVLTEPEYFKGDNRYLQEISKAVLVPILRKDFVVDPYMIYEAKVLGASAILLICGILEEPLLKEYLSIADSLGLSALVETHDKEEIQLALQAGARVIGVNNRDLRTFQVDLHNSTRLRRFVPDNVVFVSESGIQSEEDIRELEGYQVDAVLIGEALVKRFGEKKTHSKKAKVKICGISNSQEVQIMNEVKPDYVGFVFAKSPRKVTKNTAKNLRALLDPAVKVVGVFVDEEEALVCELLQEGIIDLAQLHGEESLEYVEIIKAFTNKKVIKAITKDYQKEIKYWNLSSVDYLLFDSGKGSGKTFDWEVINHVEKPFFLAGGLEDANVKEAISKVKPYGVDVSSKVEENGKKSERKVKLFMKEIGDYYA